jgi:hypothetical protein
MGKKLVLFLVLIVASASTGRAERQGEVIANYLNMRSGPGSSYSIRKAVTKGTVVRIISEKDDWLQIRIPDGTTGWVARQYINVHEDREKDGAKAKEPEANVQQKPSGNTYQKTDKTETRESRSRPRSSGEKSFECALFAGYYEPANAPNSYSLIYETGGVQFGLRLGLRGLLFSNNFGISLQYDRFSKKGECVYYPPSDGEWFKSGTDTTLTLNRALIILSYDFFADRMIVPSLGIGFGMAMIEENGGENLTYKANKYTMLVNGGLNCRIQDSLRVFGQLGYCIIPNSIGEAGVSKYYDETDLGGYSATLGLSFIFGLGR